MGEQEDGGVWGVVPVDVDSRRALVWCFKMAAIKRAAQIENGVECAFSPLFVVSKWKR
jgi:hypothetical protein